MTPRFERDYWEQHWDDSHTAAGGPDASVANPHLIRETAGLVPSTALDAGCGTGGEAIWMAARGWQVTGADISANALEQAAVRATSAGVSDRVTWVEADLTTWKPEVLFGLVVTNYAHPSIPQLAFYDRISHWVAPGGTLLMVGHLHDDDPDTGGHEHGDAHDHGHGDPPPAEATVTLADIRDRLDPADWRIDTAERLARILTGPGGQAVPLRDVIVRATRSL